MNRDFKGIWIPKDIWLNDNISLVEKIFIVEIDSLDNKNGCFASNTYFAKFFKLSNSRVSQIINSLVKKGYIQATYEREGKQIIKRVLNILNTPYLENAKNPIKNIKHPHLENAKDNNTMINNTINNNKEIIDKIYKTYPSKCPTKGTSTRKSLNDKKTIKSRLKQGHDNLIEIIKKYINECTKCRIWIMNFKTFLNNLPDYSESEYKEDNTNYGMCEAEKEFFEEQRKKENAAS